jgi:CheY-like chemotaxis protein
MWAAHRPTRHIFRPPFFDASVLLSDKHRQRFGRISYGKVRRPPIFNPFSGGYLLAATGGKPMKKVLIVDDSALVRQRLCALLDEAPGLRIVGEAADAAGALAAVNRLTPDVVVLDIRMPGPSGIEALERIKKDHPGILVIMLTNYDFDHYRRRCLASGADYFFNKAREFERVVDVLTR